MAAEFYGKEYVLFEGGTINNTEGGPPAAPEGQPPSSGLKTPRRLFHAAQLRP